MTKERVRVRCFDNFYLNVYIYGEYNKSCKGIIQISHGLGEYSQLYKEIIEYLVENFYVVVVHDHRGHGEYNKGNDYFICNVKENNFGVMVKDLKVINSFIRWRFKGEKVFLIGHSMGAYLSLKYAEVYGESLNGLVLSGIGKGNKFNLCFPEAITKTMCGFIDASKPNNFVNTTFYKVLNKSFKGKNLDIDDDFTFTTSNQDIISNYKNDNLRVKKYTLKFYQDLFNGIRNTVRINELKKIPKDLNVLLLTGSLDPVCYFEKGAKRLSKSLCKNGISIEHMIYENTRHEIFVEEIKFEVFRDIIIFLRNI